MLFQTEKKQKVVSRLRNGYITQVMTNVDNEEIVEMNGKICKIYEAIVDRRKL